MAIERFGTTSIQKGGVPLASLAVANGDMVYLCGLTADPDAPGDDVAQQTRNVLARIDKCLAMAGTSKSNVLSAMVWLTDMSLFAMHNDAWNEWVDPENPPARACLHSPQLFRPNLLVEIMVTATR